MEKNHPAFLYRLCFNVFYFLRSCNAYIILIEKASRFENNQIEMNDEGRSWIGVDGYPTKNISILNLIRIKVAQTVMTIRNPLGFL